MKYLFLILASLTQVALAKAPALPMEIQERMNNFSRPISTEYAFMGAETAWAELGVEGKEESLGKLKADLKKYGQLKSLKMISRHDSIGSKFISLTYELKFNLGHSGKLDIVFIKRIDTPYEVYDVKAH